MHHDTQDPHSETRKDDPATTDPDPKTAGYPVFAGKDDDPVVTDPDPKTGT